MRSRFVNWRLFSCLLWILLPVSVALADPVTDYNLAVQFYKQQRWQLAAEACAEFVKNYPTHAQVSSAHLYWGQALVHLRDFKQAREHFRTYLKDPRATADRPLALYRVGECSYFQNDFPAAERELAEFLEKYADNDLAEWAIVYLANSRYQQNKTDLARRTFEAALKRFPEGKLKSEAEYGLARSLEQVGQAEQARDLYEKIATTAEHPQAGEAQFHLGAGYFSRSQFQEADAAFRKLIEQFPQHRFVPIAQLNSGYALFQLQQFEQAIPQFEAAAQTASQQVTARYWLALSHKSLGKHAVAAEILGELSQSAANHALAESILFQRGDAELRAGNLAAALPIFEQVVQRWPTGELADDALHSACQVAFQQEDYEKAAALHQQFQEKYGSGGLAQVQNLLYGRILLAQGDATQAVDAQQALYRKAESTLKQVLATTQLPETSQLARFQLARAYERLDDDDALLEVLKPLLNAAEPNSTVTWEANLLAANAWLRQQSFTEAAQAYQRIIDANLSEEQQRPALAGMISILIQQQDWEQVFERLQQLEKVDPADRQFSRLSLAAGDAAYEAELWAPAEQAFLLATKREVDNPAYVAARSGLGHTLFKQEDYSAAQEVFQKLAQRPDLEPSLKSHLILMQGTIERQLNQTEAALATFESGLTSLRDNIEAADAELKGAFYALAKSAARAARDNAKLQPADGYYSEAYQTLKLLPEESQQELDRILYEWADLHYNAEDFDRSDELFRLLIQERPASTLADDAALILAESARFSGDLSSAKEQFRKLSESSQADDFIRQRALVHLIDLGAEAKEWQQVLTDAGRLAELSPATDHASYLKYRQAEAFLHTGDLRETEKSLLELTQDILQNLQQAPPWWEEVWLLNAELRLRQKDYVTLEATVNELRDLSPESKVLHRGDLLLGRSLENRARFDEARAAFARVIASETGQGTPSAAEAQFRIAESFLKQNNHAAAFKEYYKVYAGYPTSDFVAPALYQAARTDVSRKDWKGAVQTYRILLSEFPESEYTSDANKQLAEIEAAFPELKRDSP